MKKTSKKILLTAIMASSLLLTGCNQNGQGTENNDDNGTSEVVEKTFQDLKEDANKEFLKLKGDEQFKDDPAYIKLCEAAANEVLTATSRKSLKEIKEKHISLIDEYKKTASDNKLSSNELIKELSKRFKTTSITTIRDDSSKKGDEFITVGQVVGFDYTDQTTPRKKGLFLTDGDDTMCIYGSKLCEKVIKGDIITIKGTKGFYIPKNDVSSADKMGYRGQLQLSNVELLYKSSKPRDIIDSAFKETTVDKILSTDLSNDITGKIYKVKGFYSRHATSSYGGYVNYNLESLTHTASIQAYTQCNGKELTWTDKYDGKAVEMLINVVIAKPSRNLWKMTVVDVLNEDYKITPEENLSFAASKVIDELPSSIFTGHGNVILLPKSYTMYENVKFKFKSSDEALKIESLNDKEYQLTFAKDTSVGEHKIEIDVNDEKNSINKTVEHIFNVKEPNVKKEDIKTIKDVRTEDKEQDVIISGVIATVTYQANMVKQGFYIVDDTGSTFVFASSNYLKKISNLEQGQKVTIKGIYSSFIPSSKDPEEGYTGNKQIINPEVLDLEYGKYEVPTTSIESIPLEELINTKCTNNISGKIYKVNLTCDGKRLTQPDKNSVSLKIYSQTGFADYKWLEEYKDQTREFYICVHDRKKGHGAFNWRFDVVRPLSK